MDAYLAQIIMFAGNFVPIGWLSCNGALLSIAQYDALYVLIGTTYGGDGVSTFALPDLRGRAPVGAGQGSGMSPRQQGEIWGKETTTLIQSNLPSHQHQVQPATSFSASTQVGTLQSAAASNDSVLAASNQRNAQFIASNAAGNVVTLSANNPAVQTSTVGSSNVSIDWFQPSAAIQFIICVEGIFPSRN